MRDFKDALLTWMSEITLGNTPELYYSVRLDEEDRFSIFLYTEKYRYCISSTPTYLGCTVSCRKPRAGEDWTRGNDLPDGGLERSTWMKIKNAIIKHELVQVCRCDTCLGKGPLSDEDGEHK